MAGGRSPSSYLPGFAPGHKLQKLLKESGIFQSLRRPKLARRPAVGPPCSVIMSNNQ